MYLTKTINGLGLTASYPDDSDIKQDTSPAPNTDCPCDCVNETISDKWYIGEQETAGSIPVIVNEEKLDCTSKDGSGKSNLDCETIKSGIKKMGYTTLSGRRKRSLRGYSLGNDGGATDYRDTQNPANESTKPAEAAQIQPQEAGMKGWHYALLGLVAYGAYKAMSKK